MQYFNYSNSEVEYIKDKLRTEYIPTVRFFNTDVTMQPPPTKSRVWTGGNTPPTISTLDNMPIVYPGETIIKNNTIQIGVSDNNKTKYIGRCEFGKWHKNITTNYVSNKSYYDSDLHENFGRYLRAYRDYYKIDVMNFYNCFSNRYINTFLLPFVDYSQQLVPFDDNYKLVAFPIMYDTVYHIIFNATAVGKVTFQAIYFNGEVPIRAAEIISRGGGGVQVTNSAVTYTETVNKDVYVCIGSETDTYGDIATSLGEDNVETRLSKQRLLYLFMQFSSSVDGQIVVLEQPKFTYAINNELLNLSIGENEQVAFSDTLLEYITGSVVSPATEIGENVERIQNKLLQNNFYKTYLVGGPSYVGVEIPNYKFSKGVFDDGMHQIIYKAFFDVGDSFLTNETYRVATTGTIEIKIDSNYTYNGKEYVSITKQKLEDGAVITSAYIQSVGDNSINCILNFSNNELTILSTSDEIPKSKNISVIVVYTIGKEVNGTGNVLISPTKKGEKIPNFIGFVDKNVEELIMNVPDDLI